MAQNARADGLTGDLHRIESRTRRYRRTPSVARLRELGGRGFGNRRGNCPIAMAALREAAGWSGLGISVAGRCRQHLNPGDTYEHFGLATVSQ